MCQRTVGSTLIHDCSSRSHLIVTVHISQPPSGSVSTSTSYSSLDDTITPVQSRDPSPLVMMHHEHVTEHDIKCSTYSCRFHQMVLPQTMYNIQEAAGLSISHRSVDMSSSAPSFLDPMGEWGYLSSCYLAINYVLTSRTHVQKVAGISVLWSYNLLIWLVANVSVRNANSLYNQPLPQSVLTMHAGSSGVSGKSLKEAQHINKR